MAFSTEDLSKRLKKARKRSGLSRAEVSALTGASVQSIGQWESGIENRHPVVSRLVELSNLYGVSTDWLLTGEPSTQEVKSESEYELDFLLSVFGLGLEAKIDGESLTLSIPQGTPLYKAMKDVCTIGRARKAMNDCNMCKSDVDGMCKSMFTGVVKDFMKETA